MKRKKKRKPAARTAAANPTRKRKKKKARHGAAAGHRKSASNPKRSKARRTGGTKRTRKANPKRAKARHSTAGHRTRARRANPTRKKSKRRHKRNPGVPAWAMAGLAAVLGLVGFTIVSAGTFALTQRTDPSLATLIRNRRIGAGAFMLGGLALAFVSPILGAGLATGGLAVLAGTEASLALGNLIDLPPGKSSPQVQAATNPDQQLSGIFDGRARRQRFNGVFDGGRQRFNGVFDDGRQRFSGLDGQGEPQGSSMFGG